MSEQLSVSREHYLKIIYKLSLGRKGTRITDIADELKVTKASTCHAVCDLEAKGFLYRDDNHKVHLSEKGNETAGKIFNKYERMKKFFLDLGLDEESAALQACALEHVISKVDFDPYEQLPKQHT